MFVERECFTCSKFEPEFFDEASDQIFGYCTRDDVRSRAKHEHDTCKNHRFKRGIKNGES